MSPEALRQMGHVWGAHGFEPGAFLFYRLLPVESAPTRSDFPAPAIQLEIAP